ncbi:hypothetical protein EJ05DRAFT_473828 [Pseudovirgaria hyperparasitica]|uniref:Galactose oxidase n=1 Tax=Pseudovirgaria hyperparasitica TaxID=470096 RepID=A0A6A6WGT5_9PEZI|nr:uncharacterized protein EJ05DRAFT_473828 [Pseudovirgaria hyperparasitica]KAF2761305.1 hypothetical protein EJ05DRAFT_473828 [Pseudovirgaria hyperparasitica]
MKSFKSKFEKVVSDAQSKLSSNPKVNSAAQGAMNTGSSMLQGAVNFAKGVTSGHASLKATFANVTSAPVNRAGHSLAVVKGRAYIFGGESAGGALADNDMYMIILPSGGVLDADFTNIEARAKTLREGAALESQTGAIPASRKGHSAVVVGDNIYIYGGEDEKGQAVDSAYPGRVWVFDTTIKAWSALDPADGTAPPTRSLHGAASSDEPGPQLKQNVHDPLPQTPMDPAKTVPDVPEKDSWGTLIIANGRSLADNSLLSDAWAFDIRTRAWRQLPSPPAPARTGSSLAVASQTLFRFGGYDGTQHLGGGIDSFSLTNVLTPAPSSSTSDASTPLHARPWHSHPYINGLGPRERTHAGLATITTGQGRRHLLLIGGQTSAAPGSPVAYFDDVWTYALPAAMNTAAGIKDAAASRMRSASAAATKSAERPGSSADGSAWAEVRYLYLDKDGDVRPEGRSLDGRGKGIGSRGQFAVASQESDSSSVVVWGGVAGDGKVLGDGWLVTVERW